MAIKDILNKVCNARFIGGTLRAGVCFPIVVLSACSVLQGTPPGLDSVDVRNERATLASFELSQVEQVNATVKLNNEWLTSLVSTTLLEASAASERYKIEKIEIYLDNQIIYLDGIINISDEINNTISGSFSGELKINFSPRYLDWYADIKRLSISSTDFSFDGGQYAESIPELEQQVLKNLHDEFLLSLTQSGADSIPMNAVPLGEIQVGADLPGVSASPARRTEPLGGVFLKSRDALLIERDYTSIALELVNLPNLSYCVPEISVSRSAFARQISSREPVGITGRNSKPEDIRYFFTEISGARRPNTVIHYWYANGQAVAFEELHVGVSSRWRTWSSTSKKFSPGDQLEVLVVEKDSGCILLSRAIEIAGDLALPVEEDAVMEEKSLDDYRGEFLQRTAILSAEDDSPELAVIHTQRSFLISALQSSLNDLTISASFNVGDIPELKRKTRLNAFDPKTIACQRRDCPPVSVCEVNISHCKRFRDTRDCSSCLFRNPLNNRCVSEAVDPVCEASRDRQNERYDQERFACIESAEKSKQECDFQNAQASRSCQIETSFADNACDSIKSSIENLKPGAPLAYVQANALPHGTLSAKFGNFQLEGDLERLKLDISLSSAMHLAGNMNFSPGNVAKPLADCIASWSAPFVSRFANTPAVENLQSQLVLQSSLLTADWSGFGMSIELMPSPLASVLAENPQSLANCKIGLTVPRVEKAINGGDETFYRGLLKLEMLPLPTILHLAPATMVIGGSARSAEATLSTQRVSYKFSD